MSEAHECDPIIIETDVPIPRKSIASSRYPFDTLEVGHSFIRPITEKQNLRSHALEFKRHNPGWNYKTKTLPDGIRIWRTA